MTDKKSDIDRRNFLKTVGAAGIASVVASTETATGQNEPNAPKKKKPPQVPKRKLGKTGLKVPCLSLGGNQDLMTNQIILRMAPLWGVTYWDTAHNYRGGNSELGIGKFLKKNPKVRKNLFIVTKASGAKTVQQVQQRFETSLKRMNTSYIDLYYGYHQCPDPALITNELKEWAKNAKKSGLIKYFGITTHQNTAKVLTAAAKLEWLDVVMMPYNFRSIEDKKLNAAIDACHKAGLGVIAMKTQARGPSTESAKIKKLTENLQKRGFNEAQVKIKIVLEDKRFNSACVGMWTVAELRQNVAAVLDKTKLTREDKAVFSEYAQATCTGYCAGCANICSAALPDVPYVNDIMRYLMYYNSYGDCDEAKRLFAQIPDGVKDKLLDADYTLAEARCPQHLPIRELVIEAVHKLT